MTHRSGTSLLVPLLVLVAIFTLPGCGPVNRDKDPSPTGGRRHDPSQAEIDSLRQQLEAIDGVQSITEFSYQKGDFVYPSFTDATFASTANSSHQDLVTILDTAYRLTWYRSDLAMGNLIYVVQNPKTGAEVGAGDLGFDTASIGLSKLKERYGPAPTSSPESS